VICRRKRPTGQSVFPEVVEAIGGELRVEHGVLDVPVPQIVLDSAGVLTVVGGRMPQHVRMNRHAQLGRVAGASEQLTERSGGSSARPRSEIKT
jgi:hypothetical protein